MALRISDFTDEEYLKYLQIGGGDISPYQGRSLTDEEKNSIKNEILFRFDYNIGNFLKNAHFYTPKERNEARINMVSQTFEEGRSFYGLPAPRSNEEAFSGEDFRNMILYDPYVTEDMNYYYDRFAESRVGEGKINFPNLGGMTKKQFIDSFKAKNYLDDVTTRDEILTRRYGKENYEAQREEDGRHRDSAWMYSLRQTKNLFGHTLQLFGETADSIFGDPATDGGFWDWFTKVGDQWSRNAVREIEEGGYQRKYNESFAETLRKKGPAAAMGKAFEMAAENWSNSGLSLALALVPGGGAYRATKILRGAAKYVAPRFSMLEAGGVREEMIEQGVYDPTKPMGAAIWGTAAAALDWVENMYVGGKMPASYLRNRLFSQLERSHARKAAQDKFTREMLNELKRPFWYKLGRGVTIEGVTEGLQELAPIMASYQAETEENKLRNPYDWTFNISNPGSVLNRIVDASVVGGLMGGTTVTTAHTVGTISGDRKRRIDQLSGLTGQTSPTTTPNYNGTSNGQPIQVNVPGAPNGTNYFQLQNNNWLATNGVYTGEGDTAENAVKQMFSVANKDHVPLSDPVQSAPDTFTLTSIIPAGSTANSLTVDVVGNNAQAIAEQIRDLHNNTRGNIVNLKATAANNGQIRIETNNIGSDLLTYLENLSTSEQRAEFPGLEARQLQMVRAGNVPDALELDVFHYQHDNAQFEESDFFSEQDDTETKRQQRLKKISDNFRRMGFDFINTRPHKRPARSTSLKEIKVHKNGVIYTISLNTQSGSQGRDVQATVIAESLDGKAIKLPKGIAAQILSTSSTAHRGKVYFRLPTDRISVTQLQGMSGSNPTYQFESSEITRLFANTLGANITTNEADTVDFELDGKTGHMRIANDGTVLLHADGFLVSNFEFVGDLVQLGMGTAQGSTVEQAVIAGTSAAPTSAYTDVVMPDLNQVPNDVRPLLPRVNADGEYAVKYLKKSTGTTDEYYAIYLDGKYAARGTYYSKLGPNHPMPKILKVLETMFGNPRPARPTTVPDYEKFFNDNFGSQFNSTNVVQIVGGTANNKYIRVGYTTLNQRLTDDIIYANTFSNNDVSVNFSGPGFNPVKVYTLSDSAGNTRAIRAYTDVASQQQALEELYDAAPFLANIIDGGVFAENPARQEENYIRQNDAPPEAIYDETNFTNKYDRQDSTHKNIMSDIRDYHNNIRLLCEEMSIIFNYIITNQKYDVMTTITASNIAVRDILNKLTQSILDVNGKTNLKNQMDLLAQALNITGGNTNNLTLDEVRTLFAMELKRTYAKFAAFMYIVESARRNSINSGNLAAFMSTNIGGSSYSVNDIANDNLRNVITRDQLNTETEEIFAGVNAVIQSTVFVGVQPFSIGDFGNIQNLTGKDYTNDNVDIIISNVTNLNRVKFYRTLGTERVNRRVKGKEITIADELDLTASVGRDIVDGLTRNGRLVILETQEQAELVLNAINAEINYGKNGVTAGFTDLDNGVIYLVQDGIRVGEAAGALYHEFGVHLKRFGFTDPQFRDILTSLQLCVENMRQGNVLDEFYSEMADFVESKGLSRQDPLFWEEVNAHIITEAMNRGVADMDLIAKSVSWIKSFLYRHGFIKAENLNYQDLVNIVRSAMRTEARENNPSRIPSVVAAQLGIDTTPRRTPRQQEYQNIRDSISDTNRRFRRQTTRKIRKEIVTSGLLSRKTLDRMIRNGNLTIMDTQEEALDFIENIGNGEFDPKAFGVEVFYSKRGVIQGFTLSDGSAYLVSDGIPEGKAGSVLMHEVGVHARKFGFSDSQFQEILRGVQERQNDDTDEGKAIQAAIERAKKAGTKEDSDTFWEEVVAYMVENTGNIESTLLDRIKAWIKKYLFKMGFVDARDLTQRDFVFFARGVLDSARYQTSRANLGIDNVRFSYTNEEGAGRLDEAGVSVLGSTAVTRLALLEDAVRMESEGVSSADIKLLTGWERGTKNEWKWEIADNNMTLNYTMLENAKIDDQIRLTDLLNHEELYIAHPSLKDYIVEISDDVGYHGKLLYNSKTIVISEQILNYVEEVSKTLLHEIQHHIQKELGFIEGSNQFYIMENYEEYASLRDEENSLRVSFVDLLKDFFNKYNLTLKDFLKFRGINVDENGYIENDFNEVSDGSFVDNISDYMIILESEFSNLDNIKEIFYNYNIDDDDIVDIFIDHLDNSAIFHSFPGDLPVSHSFSHWLLNEVTTKEELETSTMEKGGHSVIYNFTYLMNRISEIENRYFQLEKKSFEDYKKIGGEVESRVVEDRFMMTEEERRRTPTTETEMQVEKISRDEIIDPDELSNQNQVSLVSKARNNTRVRFLINTNANVEIPSAIPGAPGVYQYKNGRTFIVQNELPRGLESETMMYGQTYANLGLIRRNPIVDRLRTEILANDYLREKITEDAAELGVDINSDTGRRKVEDLAIGLGVRRILTDPNIDDSLYQDTLDVFRDVVGDAVHLSYDQEYISPSMMAAAAGALSSIPPVRLDVPLREGFAARKRQGITDIVWDDVNERLKLVEENSDYVVIDNAPSVQLADGAYVSFEGAQDNATSVREALHDLSTRTIDEGIDDDFFYRENPSLEAFEQTGRSYGILAEMANRYNVEDFINKALPAHIADRIEVHYNETDYAKGILKKAAGIIFPFSYTKKIIHVRAWGRTLGEVIRTIGHEVSHFGWSIWNVPEFNSSIVKFYNTFEDTLMNTIPEYFAQIGYANPTPGNSLQALLSENEKIFLVNEFYSHINVSLLDDTTPNVADAMGIDSTEYAKIRDEINNGIALIETKISDIFGNTNVTQDTAKAFAKDMLKMTFGSVIGRKLNIVFDQGRPNNVGFPNARIRIFANEFGVVRRVEPLTKDAERSANYKEVVTKWDKYFSNIDPKWGKYGKMFAKFMLANIPMSNHIPGLHVEGAKLGDTPTGRITLMVGRLWQRIANSFQIDIKEKFNLMQELNAILMDNNYDPSYISYTNSYTDVFRRLGLSQKDIEKAKLLDDSINYMRKLIYEGSVEIQKAFYETGRRLRQRMLAPGTGISQARADAVYNRFIQLAGSFHSNWEHRSYEAFTQEGQADLKEMLHYLNLDSVNGQDGIYSQAATAQSFIDTSEALLRNGQISESEYQRRTKEARHTIEIRDRLEALREYVNIRMRQANMTPDGNWNAIVVRNMKAEINEIIKKANQLHSGALGREHLNMISASKSRKLDENFIVDQKYMKFLKQIQNPIYVLIDSIDQQRKIVEKIRFNIEVGEYILDSGMGSLREQKGVSGIDDSLALSFLEKGSFLEYIEVDPFFLEDIQKEIEIVKHANEIMWRGIIDAWKANSTIYNLRLGINNHVSNVGMLVFAGHAFRLGQIMSGHHIAKSQFLSKFRPDQDGNLSDFEKKMMRWLHQYRVFGGTVSEMELVTRNTGWHEKVVHTTTSMLKAMSFLENRSGHHFESFMLKWIERMRQFYAFGDEWVKPLIFINNWNNFYAKYDASESLAQGETEEQRIARVEELAARDAAEQTLRESTTWEYSPQFIRQLSTNAARQFTPDFIMHNFQMLRIMSSNVVRWAELWRELIEFGRKQNKTAKDYKWGKAITAELAQRSVGLGLLGGSFAGLAGLFGVGGAQLMAFVPYLMNVLYKGLGGDDDDEKMQEKNIRRAGNELVDKNGNILEERGWFTPNEWDGWQRLLNFMTGGNNLYAPAWRRDNESISAWNWLRSNVMYTHAPVMPAKENPLLKDRALIILQNIANINGETMARQFVENAFGRDRYGNDIGLIEGWKQIAERTLVPGGVRQIMGATIGYPFSDTRYHEGRFIKSTELFGLHFNNYDRKDITNKLGFFMAERMEGGKNRIRKNLILRLQDSRDYTNEEIASMIRDAMADNLNSFNKANYVLIGLRKTYMPEEDIKHYLNISRNTGGIVLGKELVEKYVNGVNIFDTSLVEALNNRRNQLIEKKRTLRMNPDQYDVAIRNLGTAIRMYRRALDRNER